MGETEDRATSAQPASAERVHVTARKCACLPSILPAFLVGKSLTGHVEEQVMEQVGCQNRQEAAVTGRGLIRHANLTAEAELLVSQLTRGRAGPNPCIRVLATALRTAADSYCAAVHQAVCCAVEEPYIERDRQGSPHGVSSRRMSRAEAAWKLLCSGSNPLQVGPCSLGYSKGKACTFLDHVQSQALSVRSLAHGVIDPLLGFSVTFCCRPSPHVVLHFVSPTACMRPLCRTVLKTLVHAFSVSLRHRLGSILEIALGV